MTMGCTLQVDLTLNIVERKTGGLSCGGGISSQGHSEGALPGFIGSASFSQRNLFGLNQKLAATVEIGQVKAPAYTLPHRVFCKQCNVHSIGAPSEAALHCANCPV